MVESSRSVLQMILSSTHGQAKVLPKFPCSVLPTCVVEFLDTQITGAVFMMQKTLGSIPLSEPHTSKAESAAARLKSLAAHGGIVTDTMGLKKPFWRSSL